MRVLVPLLAVLSVALLPGCVEDTTCIPTSTAAQDASKVDLVAPTGSAVLTATLTAEDGADLAGRTLRFEVLADDSVVHDDSASAGDGGRASIDLKRAEVEALAGIARGDAFSASFPGDGTYCASRDGAAFRVVRAPAGLPAG